MGTITHDKRPIGLRLLSDVLVVQVDELELLPAIIGTIDKQIVTRIHGKILACANVVTVVVIDIYAEIGFGAIGGTRELCMEFAGARGEPTKVLTLCEGGSHGEC